MDIYATTEDDWMPIQMKSNVNDGINLYSNCSSPLLFGRKASRGPQMYHEQEDQMFEMPLDVHNQYIEYQLNQENENNEFENLFNQLPTPKIRRKIRKPKNTKKYSPVPNQVVNNKSNQKSIVKQIEKCQKAKVFIDQLERILIQLKSELISTIQAQI